MNLGDYWLCHNGDQFSWYDEDELVATVEIKEQNGFKWICGVYVSPLYRRHGIGAQLLQFAVVLGGKRLRVSKTNKTAKTLYEKCGFCVFDADNKYFYMRLGAMRDASDRR